MDTVIVVDVVNLRDCDGTACDSFESVRIGIGDTVDAVCRVVRHREDDEVERHVTLDSLRVQESAVAEVRVGPVDDVLDLPFAEKFVHTFLEDATGGNRDVGLVVIVEDVVLEGGRDNRALEEDFRLADAGRVAAGTLENLVDRVEAFAHERRDNGDVLVADEAERTDEFCHLGVRDDEGVTGHDEVFHRLDVVDGIAAATANRAFPDKFVERVDETGRGDCTIFGNISQVFVAFLDDFLEGLGSSLFFVGFRMVRTTGSDFCCGNRFFILLGSCGNFLFEVVKVFLPARKDIFRYAEALFVNNAGKLTVGDVIEPHDAELGEVRLELACAGAVHRDEGNLGRLAARIVETGKIFHGSDAAEIIHTGCAVCDEENVETVNLLDAFGNLLFKHFLNIWHCSTSFMAEN